MTHISERLSSGTINTSSLITVIYTHDNFLRSVYYGLIHPTTVHSPHTLFDTMIARLDLLRVVALLPCAKVSRRQ